MSGITMKERQQVKREFAQEQAKRGTLHYMREGARAGAESAERRPLTLLDALVFGLSILGILAAIAGVALVFSGCGGQAQSAPAEQTADAPLHEDRWCCTRNNAPYGQPAYTECGLPGASIPEDAVDCFCDSYLVDCTGE